ncbi:MAG: adenylate/guanylate cyclase domain-containing protein [Archangiaceae bacterium]|nr:adenylate/guanylate cyclase domain-containing protein [Archangiaceae bacterium]
MKRDGTLTSIRSLRDEEEQVLAEHNLKSERLLSVLRLVLQVLRTAAFMGVAAATGYFSAPQLSLRPFLAFFYVLVCLITVFRVRQVKASVFGSKVAPLVLITVDYLFILSMALTPTDIDEGPQSSLIAIFCLMLLGFAALRLRRMHVIQSAVLSYGVYGVVLLHERAAGVRVSLVQVAFVFSTFAVMTVLVLQLSSRVREMFQTLRTRDNLRRFLPKQVADRVEANNMRALDPVKREVTVLFSDIRDFTASSETMDPQMVMRFLDDYFGRMSQVVQARGGTVGKFIGDGMLCYWGVPEEDAEHAEHAVQAALDMRQAVEQLNLERAHQGLEPVRIGVGVHTGPVAAGELGGKGEGLHEYTVIGDSVNLASRIEGLTKVHGVDLLVSDETWKRLGARFLGQPCGEEKVKGRSEPVRIHAVTGRVVASGSALT